MLLIESYLHGPERDVQGETALTALCRYLRLIDRYRSLIRELIMSPTDIGWSNSRMAAIHLAPIYLNGFRDDELGCQLVTIFCDPDDPEQLSARGALIEIFVLRSELRDPFGPACGKRRHGCWLHHKLACQRFGCGRRVQ
ncbi:MAG: hypothetical protein EOR73_13580 [Mesorhizobium sp.]|nr:MAG: hypothetical protein EOR73_13580 [Mesorhizobium sp.]